MAVRALNARQTKRVTHPDDTENPTVFILRPFTPAISALIRDESVEIEAIRTDPTREAKDGDGKQFQELSIKQKPGTAAYLTALYGLFSFENLELEMEDGSIQQIPPKVAKLRLPGGFEWEHQSRDILDRLPDHYIPWLASQIQGFSTPKEDEGKKSEGQS